MDWFRRGNSKRTLSDFRSQHRPVPSSLKTTSDFPSCDKASAETRERLLANVRWENIWLFKPAGGWTSCEAPPDLHIDRSKIRIWPLRSPAMTDFPSRESTALPTTNDSGRHEAI